MKKRKKEDKEKKPRFLESAKHLLRDADSIPQEKAEKAYAELEDAMRTLIQEGRIANENEPENV